MKVSSWCCLIGFTLLAGCSSEHLHVHTDYLTKERLASYHVHTPDPSLEHPHEGQRLHISWSLSKEEMNDKTLYLQIDLLYCNKEEVTITLPITQRSGTHIYSLFDDDYFSTGGIRTYKVSLFGDDQLLDEWRHQLWVDPIHFPPP